MSGADDIFASTELVRVMLSQDQLSLWKFRAINEDWAREQCRRLESQIARYRAVLEERGAEQWTIETR